MFFVSGIQKDTKIVKISSRNANIKNVLMPIASCMNGKLITTIKLENLKMFELELTNFS